MRAVRVACMAACMAVMPRAIAATSAAKDSNVRGAPEDTDVGAAKEAMIGKGSGTKLLCEATMLQYPRVLFMRGRLEAGRGPCPRPSKREGISFLILA